MKSKLLLSSLLLLTGSVFAGTCTTASLATYTTGGFSCMTGDKTFSGFDALLLSVNSTPGSLNDITVVPTATGFNFNANFQSPTNPMGISGLLNLDIFYTAMTTMSDPFTGATLQLANPAVTGLGAIIAFKAFCLNGSFTDLIPAGCESGVGLNLDGRTNITNANLNALLTFGFEPVTELGVLDSLTLVGPGFGLGSASLSGLDNGLISTNAPPPPIPEPSSLLLLGTGLMSGAGVLRRFRNNRKTS